MNKQKVIEMYLECLNRKIKDTENALESLYKGIDTAPGPTRILMKMFGLTNVREVIYLYRGVNRLTP